MYDELLPARGVIREMNNMCGRKLVINCFGAEPLLAFSPSSSSCSPSYSSSSSVSPRH
jgi:hypothetical protein